MLNSLITQYQAYWKYTELGTPAIMLVPNGLHYRGSTVFLFCRWVSGILCKVYGNRVQEDRPQEGYITCYLGNPHRYNYEEHPYMLPR